MIHAILEARPHLHGRQAETDPQQNQTQHREGPLLGFAILSACEDRQHAGMSPKAGAMLLEQIVPRLRATIPFAVRPTGSEDARELLQDAVTMAAQMLLALEKRGKTVTAGNICYYVILLMKSGRRSQSANRTDVLAPGTLLDKKSCAMSLEAPIGFCSETGEAVAWEDLLAGAHEDPASAAARNLDWAEFVGGHDGRYVAMLRCAASGQPMNSLGVGPGMSNSTLSSRKRQLAGDIRAFMGADVLHGVCQRPRWQAEIEGEQKRLRCRHERRGDAC